MEPTKDENYYVNLIEAIFDTMLEEKIIDDFDWGFWNDEPQKMELIFTYQGKDYIFKNDEKDNISVEIKESA